MPLKYFPKNGTAFSAVTILNKFIDVYNYNILKGLYLPATFPKSWISMILQKPQDHEPWISNWLDTAWQEAGLFAHRQFAHEKKNKKT